MSLYDMLRSLPVLHPVYYYPTDRSGQPINEEVFVLGSLPVPRKNELTRQDQNEIAYLCLHATLDNPKFSVIRESELHQDKIWGGATPATPATCPSCGCPQVPGSPSHDNDCAIFRDIK